MITQKLIKSGQLAIPLVAVLLTHMTFAQGEVADEMSNELRVVNIFSNPNKDRKDEAIQELKQLKGNMELAVGGLVSAWAAEEAHADLSDIEEKLQVEERNLNKNRNFAKYLEEKNLNKTAPKVEGKAMFDGPKTPSEVGLDTRSGRSNLYTKILKAHLPNGVDQKITVILTEKPSSTTNKPAAFGGKVFIDSGEKVGKSRVISGTPKQVFRQLRPKVWGIPGGINYNNILYADLVERKRIRFSSLGQAVAYAGQKKEIKDWNDKKQNSEKQVKKLKITRSIFKTLRASGIAGVVGALGIGIYRQMKTDELLDKIEDMDPICKDSDLTQLKAMGTTAETMVAIQPHRNADIDDQSLNTDDLDEAYAFHEAHLEEFCNDINQEE